MEILSLGAGVQSSALLLLSANGQLPKLDYAIFADTGWEPPVVYEHLKRLEKEVAEPAGIKIIYAKAKGNIKDDMMNTVDSPNGAIPVFVKKQNGKVGLGSRQCTRHYKVRPIEREIRKLLGAKETENGRVPAVRKAEPVNLWIGISKDEVHRAKDSTKRYINHKFPLIFDMDWDRNDCKEYLSGTGFANVTKSACVCCVFRKDNGLLDIKRNFPKQWDELVEFDKKLREAPVPRFVENYHKDGNLPYIHESGVPLDEAVLSKDAPEESFSCAPWTCEWERP